MFKKPHIILFFLLIWGFSFSQKIKNYTLQNGLPSNHVYRITQDLDGFIWIITDKGIAKFNGKNFTTFTTKNGLPTNDIWDIKITPDNKKWFFAKANKCGYIENDSIFSFPSITKQILFPRKIKKNKNSITFDDGANHFYLEDGLWKTIPLDKNFNIVNNKKVYLSPNKDFFQFDNTKLIFPKKFNYKNVTHNEQINDSLYFVSQLEKYLVFNLKQKKMYAYSYTSQKLPKKVTYVRGNDVNGTAQITGMNFVGFLNFKGEITNLHKIPEKYNSHTSFIDNFGNVWAGTFNKGVYFFQKNTSKTIANTNKIQFLKYFDDKLYVGIYQKGLFELRKDSLHSILKNSYFQFDISKVKNQLLYTNNFEFYSIKNNQKTLINSQAGNSPKNTLLRKKIGFNSFIFGNNSHTINKINPKSFAIEKQFPLFGITSYATTKKSLFVTTQGGLFILQNDSLVRCTHQPIFNKPFLSASNFNENEIILGSDGYGAYLTNGNKATFIKGTEERSIENIFVDTQKNIWLATEKGVYKATKTSNVYEIVQIYTNDDGLISNKTNSVVVKNDSLFVATDIGLSIIDLKNTRKNKLLNLYVKSFNVNGKPISTHKQFPYSNKNQLSVVFNAIYFGNHNNLEYSYKLAPLQEHFNTIQHPEINFSNLKVGNYKLHLAVTNHHKKTIHKLISFEVTPLWYQTNFSKLFLGIFGIGLFLFLNYLNNKRIKKNARRKAEIRQQLAEQELYALRSQMNPHFVFNSLNAIQYYMTQNELELSEKYLVRFSKLIRMFFDFSAKKTISITQEINLLKGYLEIEKMRFGSGLNYKFTVDNNLNTNTQIPTMLLQPIVENAVNHGIFHNNKQGTVSVFFQHISKKDFLIIIEDNGIGIQKSKEIKAQSIKKHQAKSTKIIANRIKLLNESNQWEITYRTIDLTQKNQQGTKVILTFEYLL